MKLLTLEKYSGISADRSQHRTKPVSHALWVKFDEKSIELKWLLVVSGFQRDLQQFNNRPVDRGTRVVNSEGLGQDLKLNTYSEQNVNTSHFCSVQWISFFGKGWLTWQTFVLSSKNFFLYLHDGYDQTKSWTLFKANLHSVSASASEFFCF